MLEQVYLLDRSVAAAARALDLPIGALKSRACYAQRQLRTLLPQPAEPRVHLTDRRPMDDVVGPPSAGTETVALTP